MKSPLRRITIEDNLYIYTIGKEYEQETRSTTIIIRIFLNRHKSRPLIIHFVTYCDTLYGHPLNGGVDLVNRFTNETTLFSIHRPLFIRGLIMEAIKRGWTGTNTMDIQNGIDYLYDMGFDISHMSTRP